MLRTKVLGRPSKGLVVQAATTAIAPDPWLVREGGFYVISKLLDLLLRDVLVDTETATDHVWI